MEIAKAYGFKCVAIVSDKAHSFMIKYLSNKFNHDIDADFVPAKWRSVIRRYWNKFDLNIDYAKAYQPGFITMLVKKTGTQRKVGTSGILWNPSEEVRWSYGSELVCQQE
jgi:hypothetical protein